MKTTSYELLVNAAGQLMQQHAFDHLSDQKLSRMYSCFRKIGESDNQAELASAETELLNLCSEANLYVETTTPQSLHQWHQAMSYFGLMATAPVAEEVE
jgi:methionyl-tRNA synthetase